MLKTVKRMTSGYLDQSFESRSSLHDGKPLKSLTKYFNRSKGRDALGHISVRHKGAGAKRLFRQISTLEENLNIEAKVLRLEYDPNRTANIALIELTTGEKKYIIAPENLKVDDVVIAADKAPKTIGSRSMLKNFPVGVTVYEVQTRPNSTNFMIRSAGASALIMAHDGDYTLLKLPSGELRKIHSASFASLGKVSNSEHSNIRIGKAGRVRKMGIRPSVRGKVMSVKSHPHGGGEGVNPIGLKYPKTPWGKIAIGGKTRGKKNSDKFIVKRRRKKR
ncbi:MAG: 50S ribosomal protein L2 [candidate division WS2 bacterium ADurb.Bin280]|uniref:Large ribosomal subunit protein uL2 n=1 Tax=candidate division WS2 bacterium ADurb.Bin280 TaxID=1852829 RepID=A0A1V5SE28_9BACT|nr:MAG: 50S ribosomal protein L2 [candidate division WS2 bacterium ADurb.Bin280]